MKAREERSSDEEKPALSLCEAMSHLIPTPKNANCTLPAPFCSAPFIYPIDMGHGLG